MDTELSVRRFAIKYNPPTLVVEYKIGSSLFLKKIKIKSSNITDADGICTRLVSKYSEVLGPDKVDREQLIDLIRLLLSGQEQDAQISAVSLPKDINHMDLNKVDDETLFKAKRVMDVNFERNRLKPTDPGYVWDKEVEFQPAEEDCDWDEDDSED